MQGSAKGSVVNGVRNHNWYNRNETRCYPLDPSASHVDDSGTILPFNILTDLQLRFPDNLGTYAAISSLAVTKHLVSLTIVSVDDYILYASSSAFSPLASVAVELPLDESRHYAIRPFVDGVGGWVVFGGGVNSPVNLRFTNTSQSLLSPRAAKAYKPLPVTGIGKEDLATALTGLVTLTEGTDIEIVRETIRFDESDEQDAIIIRLKSSWNRNVYADYIGPCGGRPESRDCNKPGIEVINTVQPDCDGNIDIVFQQMRTSPLIAGAGVAVDLPLGLTTACASPGPRAAQELCPADSSSQSVLSLSSSISTAPPEDTGNNLPFSTSFANGEATDFSVQHGEFLVEDTHNPEDIDNWSYRPTATSRRNVSVWIGGTFTDSRNKQAMTQLKLHNAAQAGGGLIVNYCQYGSPSREHYYTVELDYDQDMLMIRNFNGYAFASPLGTVGPLQLQLGHWYELTASAERIGDAVDLTAEVRGITDPSVSAQVTITAPEWRWYGIYGVGTDRGDVAFSFFQLQEL